MIHIEFFVEDFSFETALHAFLPCVLSDAAEWRIHSFQGKPDLLNNLPARLKSYAQWMPDTWRIVVLVDCDTDSCLILKSRLDTIAQQAGLTTRLTRREGSSFQILNRIAIEELEAWYFGDVPAICAAYPRVSPNLAQRAPYRNPDAITGGTWEALERELQRAGYHMGGLMKIAAAHDIGVHLQPERNRSASFQCLYRGLQEIVRSS